VRPNYELEEQILKQGERVTVLEPEWLREIIRNRISKAIEKYI
jgi:predicted DNA-binding transcriptional regulator YafY